MAWTSCPQNSNFDCFTSVALALYRSRALEKEAFRKIAGQHQKGSLGRNFSFLRTGRHRALGRTGLSLKNPNNGTHHFLQVYVLNLAEVNFRLCECVPVSKIS